MQNTPHVVIIIQARMGSTRLPGKLLLEVLKRPLLSYQIERLQRVQLADSLVVATTTSPRDQQVVDFCHKEGIAYFRGSEEDVLDRYYLAAKHHNADVVVRITADCPLIDPEVVDQVIAYYLENRERYDYVSNTIERTFPRGFDVEVFSFDQLEQIAKQAVAPYEREHVTPYFYEHLDRFRLSNVKCRKNLSSYRWTVDTQEDFDLISAILTTVYPHQSAFTMKDVLEAYEAHPEWNTMNADVVQKPLKK